MTVTTYLIPSFGCLDDLERLRARIRTGLPRVAVVALVMLSGAQTAFSQKPPANNSRDEAGVTQAAKGYLAALERGDAKAIADFWTPEGSYIDETGQASKVRELVAKIAANKGASRPRAKVGNVNLRFIAADVAIEEGDCEIASAIGPSSLTGRFSALWVRQNGKWKLDQLHEWRSARGSANQHLAPLEPFVGQWSGKTDNLSLNVVTRWTSGKAFLHRELSISIDGKETFSATQEIGWDLDSQQIRSWIFNSDGSHGEAVWSLEGNVWLATTTRLLPNGDTATSTYAYKFANRDTLIVRSIGTGTDGESSPGFEIKLSRVPAKN